jgi:LysR family transcriptional regulator, low CO2-responsive transcriptional regulator
MILRQLEVFLAVIDSGSFSAGARNANTTQSTVSQHIAALEAEFSVRLMERSRNGVILTEAGEIFNKHARRILGEVRGTNEAMNRYRGIEDATLRIAASTIPGTYLVPRVVADLCARLPHLAVRQVQGDSKEVIEAVINQGVEVAVVGNRFEERGLTYEPIGNDEIFLVVPGAHPWAARPSVRVNELIEAPFIVREPGSGTAKAVVEALSQAGMDVSRQRIRLSVCSNDAVKAAVIAGVGISFLSGLAVRNEVNQGVLAVVPVEGLHILRHFCLVRRTNRELTPAASAFWELMIETYG